MGTIVDLKNKVFGRLKVTGRSMKPYHGQVMWICRCECGKICKVAGYSLRQKRTRSCGCLSRELGVRNIKKDAPFNLVWRAYHCSVKVRKLSFKLSRKEFRSLITAPCYYCGAAPSRRAEAQSGMFLLYNGIDRMDSAKGYEKSNCVPCCTPCNFLKKDIPIIDFIQRIRTIAKNTRNSNG